VDIETYLKHYERFHEECRIDTSVQAKNAKLVEEVCEYLEAHAQGDKTAADEEAIDILNMAISLCVSRGIHNPLYFGYLKLEKTAVKYMAKSVSNGY